MVRFVSQLQLWLIEFIAYYIYVDSLYVIINMVRFVSQLQLWLIEFKHLRAIRLSKFSYTPLEIFVWGPDEYKILKSWKSYSEFSRSVGGGLFSPDRLLWVPGAM